MTDLSFMRQAAKIASQTKCWIGVGCVIAKDGKVLVKAWNETLPGEEYCQTKQECIREKLRLSGGQEPDKVCSIHAEIKAIATAARRGISLRGATIFATSFPCLICLRAIIATGLNKIVYMNDFYQPHHPEMIKKNNIIVEQIPEVEVWKKT